MLECECVRVVCVMCKLCFVYFFFACVGSRSSVLGFVSWWVMIMKHTSLTGYDFTIVYWRKDIYTRLNDNISSLDITVPCAKLCQVHILKLYIEHKCSWFLDFRQSVLIRDDAVHIPKSSSPTHTHSPFCSAAARFTCLI